MDTSVGARSRPLGRSTEIEAPLTLQPVPGRIAGRKPLTVERLLNAQRYLAQIVTELGEDALPLYEAITRELQAAQRRKVMLQDALRLAGAA